MFQQFLKVGLWIQCKRTFLARQTNFCSTCFKNSRSASSGRQNVDDDDMNKPIKYSTSPAATWRAEKSRNPTIDRHPQESNIVSISLAVFLLYFLVLREENDIDTIFSQDLSDRFPDMNITQTSLSHSK